MAFGGLDIGTTAVNVRYSIIKASSWPYRIVPMKPPAAWASMKLMFS